MQSSHLIKATLPKVIRLSFLIISNGSVVECKESPLSGGILLAFIRSESLFIGDSPSVPNPQIIHTCTDSNPHSISYEMLAIL